MASAHILNRKLLGVVLLFGFKLRSACVPRPAQHIRNKQRQTTHTVDNWPKLQGAIRREVSLCIYLPVFLLVREPCRSCISLQAREILAGLRLRHALILVAGTHEGEAREEGRLPAEVR